MTNLSDYLKSIERELTAKRIEALPAEVGVVKEVKDGVAILNGLNSAFYGEIVEFESGAIGFIIDMSAEEVGVVVLGEYEGIAAGENAKSTGLPLSIPVTEGLKGRIVNALGSPLDRGPKLKADKRYPIERIAPGVVERRPVQEPLATGIMAIDALVPVGRGQRELIIGDRATGKTTLAIDTIINQKDSGVICIYCAVGQRNSKVAAVMGLLKQHKAMDYTIVVAASASDSAANQYLAPYTACAIAEYFMDKKKDVLVVYDDLTKHAWAYRQMSLILRRPAGREAYPGDIFYLHSRLLERACRRDEKYGGGSITALPIIETLEGDVSAYIPTNVISITDGQIFLETELFNAGIRPAINVGISVSRVGGSAQTRAMKQIAGRLKLDLAQYREMASFSQFESELDEETRRLLTRGSKVTQTLVQKNNEPLTLALEVAIIWSATQGYLDDLPTAEIGEFKERLLRELGLKNKKLLAIINSTKTLDKDGERELEKVVKSVLQSIKK